MERTISNVAPGVFGTDAVNVNQLRNKVHKLDRDLSGGIAAAAAQVNAMPYLPGIFTVGMSGASYNGEGAVGFTISRWSCKGSWDINAGVSYGFHDTPIFRGGIVIPLGKVD
jgi:autotransporter adhesin